MSLNSKLRTALGVVFILTTAGAISVTAQTQAVADSSSTSAATNAATTSEPKKAEGTKPASAPSENPASDKTSEVNRSVGNSNVVAAASAPTATAKTETSSEPTAPRGPQTTAADTGQYEVFAGVGYSITPKIALIGGYRVLDLNYNRNNLSTTCRREGPSSDWDSSSRQDSESVWYCQFD
jgi:hypothetical protein